MLYLQKQGAHNINLVSPTPYLYHVAHALFLASQKGLTIPIAYNTSGYERREIIRELDGLIDIYMPDIKYTDERPAKKYSGVANYLNHAPVAVEEMFRQVGTLTLDQNGVGRKGLIIRHLILPGEVENSIKVLDLIKESSFKDCHLSLMSQYFPAYKAKEVKGIQRRLMPEEYNRVKEHAINLGFENGWFQDL